MTAADDLMPFLVVAMDRRGTGEWTATRVRATPDVAHYATGWMRPGDAGVVALLDDRAVGAAWWRTFSADDPGYGYVDAAVPEIGLGVLPAARGRGAGTTLLDALVARAREERLPGLSLSVEDGNVIARTL